MSQNARVLRSQEIAAALQSIVAERQIDVEIWRRDWRRIPRPQEAEDLPEDLARALWERTGCTRLTARKHIQKLLFELE